MPSSKSSNNSAPPATKHPIEGHWRSGATLYRDNLVRLVIDLPDTAANRRWIKSFMQRWKRKLKQLELWMISYTITIE